MKFKFPSGVAREFALLNNNKFSDLRNSEILISLKILFSLKMSNEKSEKGFKIDEIKKIQIKLEELKIPKKQLIQLENQLFQKNICVTF